MGSCVSKSASPSSNDGVMSAANQLLLTSIYKKNIQSFMTALRGGGSLAGEMFQSDIPFGIPLIHILVGTVALSDFSNAYHGNVDSSSENLEEIIKNTGIYLYKIEGNCYVKDTFFISLDPVSVELFIDKTKPIVTDSTIVVKILNGYDHMETLMALMLALDIKGVKHPLLTKLCNIFNYKNMNADIYVLPIDENHINKRENVRCIMCMDQDRNSMFEPCHHFATCDDCAMTVLKEGIGCPICRQPVTKTTFVYQC